MCTGDQVAKVTNVVTLVCLLSVILYFGTAWLHQHVTITSESGDLELSHVHLMLGVLAGLPLLTCPHLAATLAVRLALHPIAVG